MHELKLLLSRLSSILFFSRLFSHISISQQWYYHFTSTTKVPPYQNISRNKYLFIMQYAVIETSINIRLITNKNRKTVKPKDMLLRNRGSTMIYIIGVDINDKLITIHQIAFCVSSYQHSIKVYHKRLKIISFYLHVKCFVNKMKHL